MWRAARDNVRVRVRVLWLCSRSAGEGGAGNLKSETEGSGQACGGGALACCVFVQKARAALTETAITAIGYSLITPEQIQNDRNGLDLWFQKGGIDAVGIGTWEQQREKDPM